MKYCILLSVALLLLSAGLALAIPSPELVIGSVSSLSQVFAVGAATIAGGGTVFARRMGRQRPQNGSHFAKICLGLFAVSVALLGLNVWQFQTAKSNELTRLQATLVRPAQFDGTAIQDESLIETGYSAQQSSPLAISTSEVASLLQTDGQISLIDVRETGEHLMGTLPGATHVRYPDFSAETHANGQQTVVLFCHNGNRSSETCEKLAALGIDCRFIAGGIEKWLVEGRTLSDQTIRSLGDLRSLPDYPNKDHLIGTEGFSALRDTGNLQIVDTRYPGDFATGHLPNAINIPVRALPTAELSARINALSNMPTVAACYDRRSCFMAQVLGHELTQAGIPFVGRYTTPWEFFIPPPPKPHVAAWLTAQNQTLWDKLIAAVVGGVVLIAKHSHLAVALFALSLTSRLLILPISLKSERDQVVGKKHENGLKTLKQGLKHDPIRKARAIQQHYDTHGMTPYRNLIGLLFLPLMMLGLSSAELAGQALDARIFGLDMAVPDPTWIMPFIFSVVACIYLQWVAAKSRKQAVLWWVIGLPCIFVLVVRLTTSGNLYLIFSLLLLLAQRGYVLGWHHLLASRVLKLVQQSFHRLPAKGIYRLVVAGNLTGTGNKSLRLARMKAAGFPVPTGIVITGRAIADYQQYDVQKKQWFADLIWHEIGERPCAVRSSAASEDGESASFAGVFESVLNVGRDQMVPALDQVISAFSSVRATDYSSDHLDGSGNILVQQMIDAEFAGVLFTQDPTAAGMQMIELVEGCGEDLVSGRKTPMLFRFGRYSLTQHSPDSPPIDLGPLLAMGQKIEEIFGTPQDIEWAYANGQFYILQSRDITATMASDTEWARLFDRFKSGAADDIILAADEMSEVLPEPTPLSFSLMAQLWSPGGSLDHACRRLGLAYSLPEGLPGHLVQVFGRTYVDCQLKDKTALRMSRAKAKQLTKSAPDFLRHYKSETLPRLRRQAQRWGATQYTSLPQDQIIECITELRDIFVQDAYVEAEVVNIYADFLTSSAQKIAATDPAQVARLQSPILPSAPTQIIAANKASGVASLLTQMGHRAALDYEVSSPRYAEDMTPLIATADAIPVQPAQFLDEKLDDPISLALAYQDLKELAKHEALRFVAELRRALLALGEVTSLGDLVFYMTVEDLTNEGSPLPDAKTLTTRRDTREALLSHPPLSAHLSLTDLERLSGGEDTQASEGAIAGTCVSGSQSVRAPVFKVPNAVLASEAFAGFNDGDIIVCRMLNPDWLPYVLRSGGIVTEVGGWLSHMAIVAREKGLVMLVNCSGLDQLETGDIVTLDPAGGIAVERQDTPAAASN